MSVNIFCSYAHKDKTFLENLRTHLNPVLRENDITLWDDGGISAGAEWDEEIKKHLEAAQIILLLVSSDFLDSKYCYDQELKRAMERHDLGKARVIPILLRPCEWKGTPFGRLQALPKEGKPISTWRGHDSAYTEIAKGIKKAIVELSPQHSVSKPLPPVNTLEQDPTNPLSSIKQNVKSSPLKMSEPITKDDTFNGHKNLPTESLPINIRIEKSNAELLWRYYATHALRLSLLLICDELPGNDAGILLPLFPNPGVEFTYRVEDLKSHGESFVGWLSKSRSSHTLFTPAPSFQYPTNYCLLPLTVMKDDTPLEEPKDRTLIVLDRQDKSSKMLSLTKPVVETIRLLLTPLYEEAQRLRSYFGLGMRDDLEPAPNLDDTAISDPILDGLADMVVLLGGRTNSNQNRWRFCCILLPIDPLLPLQQNTLIVRAQSQLSQHTVGETKVEPEESVFSLSMRAYLSGNVLYRSAIADEDATIGKHRVEGPVKSAIAIPIGGENGSAMAVLYVASYERNAFSDSQQAVLRMVSQMIEEALLTYHVRQQEPHKLRKIIECPLSVDPFFEEDFLSENDFVNDVAKLLTPLRGQIEDRHQPKLWKELPLEERKEQYRTDKGHKKVVSFIAVEIDDPSSLATKYGKQVARHLTKAVGLRMKEQRLLNRQPYHLLADRFYLLLKGVAFDEARDQAERLRIALEREYCIDSQDLLLPQGMPGKLSVTVHLGVASYGYGRLKHLLEKNSPETDVVNVRGEIISEINQVLEKGLVEGGNTVFSWDVDIWDSTRWPPTM